MRPTLALALALALAPTLAPPSAHAQAPPPGAIDLVVVVPAQGAPTQEGPSGILAFTNATPGERVEWRLTSPREHVTIELRVEGAIGGVERAEQIVPLLVLDAGEARCIDVRAKGACDDATFVPWPNERVGEAAGIARVYHRMGSLDQLALRLNVPGPANGSLVLTRDVTAPVVDATPPREITHYGFYLETRTDELAIVDVQVRKLGDTEWVRNPTPEPNLLQRFPVQGLAPDTEYEYRVVAEDWSLNTATGPVLRVRSAPAPQVPAPVVTPIDPAPNATLEANGIPVVVRARVESPDHPVVASSIALFFDKRAVSQDIVFDGRNLSYTPREILGAGLHTVAIEATNEAGGKGVARWSFEIAGPDEAPLPGVLLAVAALALAVARRRR